MNEGPDFQPRTDDGDDARDPLLGALRQRLGERFGQEPPPALWASIRQQLPAAAPRPWWLRRRGLLALLALVGTVLLSGVAVWLAGPRPAARRLAHSPAAQPAVGARAPGATSAATTATTLPPVASSPAPATNAAVNSQGFPASQAPRATARRQALSATGQAAVVSAPGYSEKPLSAAVIARPAKHEMRSAALAAPRQHRRQQPRRATSGQAVAATAGHQPGAASSASTKLKQPAGNQPTAVGAAASATAGRVAPGAAASMAPLATSPAATRPARQIPMHSAAALGRHQSAEAATTATTATALATTRRQRRAAGQLAGPREGSRPAASQSASASPAAVAAVAPPAALDSLAGQQAPLLLAAATAPPAPLAPRPDSAGPWLPPARRWSVLVLAGPTVSYRATGQLVAAQPSYAAIPSPTTAAGNFAGAASATSLAGLEQPAAGLGAQVQVRRVLTGRWALALGAGYQEYATRLALQVTSQQAASPLNSSVRDSTFAVHQRDTYRFLTLPVQLSYALAPPRGRLSLGLLAGLEPSLYVSGRTSEGSTCSCQQQAFTSASGSPYTALTLGLSLGLDARYRLGGPAARWQWVLQPTGRYVATRFVRTSSLGYTPRQPFSFGLLTGFSWDLR